MKYWRGYLTAAILGFFAYGLTLFAKGHSALIDMVYPYLTRLVQTFLADWSSGVDFLLWQLLAVILILGVLASIVLMIVLRWNPIQWFGWVLAAASVVVLLHTGLYGLNGYSGSIAEDIRLTVTEYSLSELEGAATYYRDQAIPLADSVARDADGNVDFADFQTLAQQAGEGFDTLVYEEDLSIFACSTLPVKELGWADMYTSMGITGFTMSLTGEAAVNPQIPDVALPFTMCHEMAHRGCIATESDANMAAFLACRANSSPEFQYSGYFMAFRYCYNALLSHGTEQSKAAAQRVLDGVSDKMYHDLQNYSSFFASRKDEGATKLANDVNDAYIKLGGDERGTDSYGAVCDLLAGWYVQNIILPQQAVEDQKFDPYDETQVDLTGIVNAKVPNDTND